jgi:hypothetical protein
MQAGRSWEEPRLRVKTEGRSHQQQVVSGHQRDNDNGMIPPVEDSCSDFVQTPRSMVTATERNSEKKRRKGYEYE